MAYWYHNMVCMLLVNDSVCLVIKSRHSGVAYLDNTNLHVVVGMCGYIKMQTTTNA